MTPPPAAPPLTDADKLRLAIAARVAGGLAANPEALAMPSWEGEIARAAWTVAGRLVRLAQTGGC